MFFVVQAIVFTVPARTSESFTSSQPSAPRTFICFSIAGKSVSNSNLNLNGARPLHVETDDAIFIPGFHGFLPEIEIADVDIERLSESFPGLE
jgi:hypothetical protein